MRRVLAEAAPGPLRVVRVNGAGSEWFEDDVAALEGLALAALVLPKATPAAVAALGPVGPPVIALVETAQGLRLAYETAAASRVEALALGAVDLGLELGLEPRADGQEVLFARSKLVLDSAAAGIRGPFDLVHVDVRDTAGLEAECRLARSLGLRGKSCIHPAQLELVNAVFAPSDGELERARRVVDAYERGAAQGRGAVALDGEMIDLPVVERARRLLAEAKGAYSMPTEATTPKEWRGRFYEDFAPGDVFRSRLGRTVTETDNIWFTCLTMNTNQVHFNDAHAERTQFGRPLVNSAFTLALVVGLTVPDTSENATANLGWTDITLPRPVFAGDTLWAESEILEARESRSNPNVGIVSMRCRGINQRREVVIEFRRTFMIYKRSAQEAASVFPGTDADWTV